MKKAALLISFISLLTCTIITLGTSKSSVHQSNIDINEFTIIEKTPATHGKIVHHAPEQYTSPFTALRTITNLFITPTTPNAIKSPVWGALVALKKKLPEYLLPPELIAQIALYITECNEHTGNESPYSYKERWNIIMELAADDNFKKARTPLINHLHTMTERHYHHFNPHYLSPLQFADSHGYEQLIPYLYPHDSILGQSVDQAVEQNNFDQLQQLKTINTQPPNYFSGLALITAAGSGNTEIVKFLLEEKVNPNSTTLSGLTALMSAAASGHLAIVQILLAAQAKVNMQENLGFTALHFAASNGHSATVQELLDHGANQTLKNIYGSDASRLAYLSGKDEVEKLFQK